MIHNFTAADTSCLDLHHFIVIEVCLSYITFSLFDMSSTFGRYLLALRLLSNNYSMLSSAWIFCQIAPSPSTLSLLLVGVQWIGESLSISIRPFSFSNGRSSITLSLSASPVIYNKIWNWNPTHIS